MSTKYLLLLFFLLVLILFSVFFSASETAMMSVNRYRLRHLARKGDKGANRIIELLDRPDRLLGVILIGNTFANILASAVATLMASHYFGDAGIALVTLLLTLVILIFAETAPKTLAALYPERVAWPCSVMLKILLKTFYPLVWLVNGIANGILRLFGVKLNVSRLEALTVDELRSLIHEAKEKISPNYRKTLLRILDLEKVTVEDIMVPRNEIFAIDLDQNLEVILQQLYACEHSFVPVFHEDINHLEGILDLRKVLITLRNGPITKQELLASIEEAYFVPKEATANQQLLNFRHQQKMIGLVVDEYGDIQGLITIQDLLKEIVGEFTREVDDISHLVINQKDGSFLVDGSVDIRDLVRITEWKLPSLGPRTLSGLIIEFLEMIPPAGVGVRIAGYPMEIVRVSQNTIKLVRIWPTLYQEPSNWE